MGNERGNNIKLPSLKDLKEKHAKRSQVQSHFQASSSHPVSCPQITQPLPSRPTPGASSAARAQATHAPGRPDVPQAANEPNHNTEGISNVQTGSAGSKLSRYVPSSVHQLPHNPQTFQQPLLHASTPTATPPGTLANSYSSQIGSGNAILVNKNQNGNPVLKQLRNINYRFADVVPDYQFNDKSAAIFLSLKFHRLQPAYVHNRIKALQRGFRTFILCNCDVEDPVNPLAQVSKAAIDHSCTLLVAFSDMECARYLELLKAYENKPADSLKPRVEAEHTMRVASVLTGVRAVNKTDSATLGSNFNTLAMMFQSSEDKLGEVPGLGPTKVKRLHSTFNTPFFKTSIPTGSIAEASENASIHTTSTGTLAHVSLARTGDEREWIATQEAAVLGDDLEEDDDDFM